jgi:hypothetical protein
MEHLHGPIVHAHRDRHAMLLHGRPQKPFRADVKSEFVCHPIELLLSGR